MENGGAQTYCQWAKQKLKKLPPTRPFAHDSQPLTEGITCKLGRSLGWRFTLCSHLTSRVSNTEPSPERTSASTAASVILAMSVKQTHSDRHTRTNDYNPNKKRQRKPQQIENRKRTTTPPTKKSTNTSHPTTPNNWAHTKFTHTTHTTQHTNKHTNKSTPS